MINENAINFQAFGNSLKVDVTIIHDHVMCVYLTHIRILHSIFSLVLIYVVCVSFLFIFHR